MRTKILKPRGPVPPWMAPLVDGFLRHLARRGRRPNTRQAYRFELADFGHYLLAEGVGSLQDVTRYHVEGFQDDQAQRKAARTCMTSAAALKGFLKWTADEDDLPMSDRRMYERVMSPKIPPASPRPIPRADLEVLMQALAEPDFTSLLQLRARALFWILYTSGSRISPVLELDRGDIRDLSVDIIQKGGGHHTLLFSEQAVSAVDDYMSVRTDHHKAMFVGHPQRGFGRRGDPRLSVTGADLAWTRLCRELGIGSFCSHRIRHTTATNLLRAGVDSVIAAKQLGHRGMQHIANYAEVHHEQRYAAIALLSIPVSAGPR